MNIFDGHDIIPSKPVKQYHEFKCYQCGFQNRFIKPESFVDYEKEYKIERSIRNSLTHELNELMSFSELHYGMNPSKDKLIEALTNIRNKFSGEDRTL